MILGIGECLVNAAVTLTITQSSSHRYDGRGACVARFLRGRTRRTGQRHRRSLACSFDEFPEAPDQIEAVNPLGRIGRPGPFLPSDAGSDVNGQVIAVGGGANPGSAAC